MQKKKVVIFDSSGGVVTAITVPDPEFLFDEAAEAPVLALSWHPSGSHLAVLPRGQPFAMVWSAGGETARVDSGIKARSTLQCGLHCCSAPCPAVSAWHCLKRASNIADCALN